MKPTEIIWKEWRLIQQLSETTFLCLHPSQGIKVLRRIDIPASQSEVFDYLASGKSMPEIEELYTQKAHMLGKHLERMHYLNKDGQVSIPQEYELMRQPGHTGWQITEIKDWAMPLKDYQRYHSMDTVQTEKMAVQILQGLEQLLQAGMVHGHIDGNNILVKADSQFMLDDAGIHPVLSDSQQQNEILIQNDLKNLALLVIRELVEDETDLETCLKKIEHAGLADILERALDASQPGGYENPWQMRQDLEKLIKEQKAGK